MKRISIAFLTLIILFTNTKIYAIENSNIIADNSNITNNGLISDNGITTNSNIITYSEEMVTAIVELNDSSILDKMNPSLEEVNDYLHTEDSIRQKDKLLEKQQIIKDTITTVLNRKVEYNYSYTNAFNGFSAVLTRAEIERISEIKGIESVSESQKYKVENNTYATQSKVIVGNQINTVDIGFKGEGMVVAVIDSGVDFTHEDFRLLDPNSIQIDKNDINTLLNDKDLKATSITNNYIVENYYINEKFPFGFDYADKDNNTMPVDNHGTHVAGIIAANTNKIDGITGIAPETQILSMKVFGNENEQASDEDIIAAIEDSISLGADVINLSLGYPTGVVIDESIKRFERIFKNAENIGITVVCATGNESKVGTIGNNTYQYTLAANPDSGFIAFPASLASVLAVASSNDKSLVMPYFSLSSGENVFFTDSSSQVKLESFDTILNGKQLELEYVGLGAKEDFIGKNVRGKIAVIDRGTYTFNEKVLNAEQNGAVGVIVINYDIENLLMLLTDVRIPAISVTSEFKNTLMDAINSDNANSIVVAKGATAKVSNIDTISKFSSSGVTSDLKLKPDISAPGEQILSTAINNTIIAQNGTSMASPQVSGAILLMNQYIKSLDTKVDYSIISELELAKMLLMSSARIAKDVKKIETSPRQQGAGILDIVAATKSSAFLYNKFSNSTKIELGDKLAKNTNNMFTMQFTIRNITGKQQVYDVSTSVLTSNLFTEADGQVFSIDEEYKLNASKINFRYKNNNINKYAKDYVKETISLAPYEEKTFTLDVFLAKEDIEFLNKSVNGTFVEGFIECKSNDLGQPVISIPYMGFYGDWAKLPILDSSVYDTKTSYFNGQNVISEDNGIEIELGENAYLSDGEATYDYDLIAISPNNDRKNEFMMASINLLRDTKSLAVDIKNNKGEMVTNWTFYENMPKTQVSKYVEGKTTTQTMRYFGRDKNQNILPEGNYTYIVKAELQVQSGVIDTWEIPFVIDNTSPIITSYAIKTINGVQTLELNLKDNHYIQTVVVEDQNKNIISQLAIKEKYTKNETFKVSIPLVNINGSEINVKLIDYANNELNQKIAVSSSTSNIYKIITTSYGEKIIDLTDYISQISNANSQYLSLEKASLLDTIIKNSVNKIKLDLGKVNSNVNTIDIALEVIKALTAKNVDLLITHNELTYEIPAKVLSETNNRISIIINKNVLAPRNNTYKNIGYNYEFNLYSNGTKLNALSNQILVKVKLKNTLTDLDKISNFTFGANQKWIQGVTYLDTDTVVYKIKELGFHSLMIMDKKFKDVNGGWAVKYINSLASKGIIKGTSDTTFSPLKTITRAEFVALVVRTMDTNITVNSSIDFIGMDKNSWYYNEMILAKQLGLIEGDTYDALAKINRFEMAMIVAKAHAIINNQEVTYNGKLSFTDVPADSTATYIGYAKENGLISGYLDNTFRPANNATREEITRVIYELIN
ncbi:MAG: peptidase [Clostridiales bacterium]|jgi:lactocepin|nr:peptidase [Clostridiales bacterium]